MQLQVNNPIFNITFNISLKTRFIRSCRILRLRWSMWDCPWCPWNIVGMQDILTDSENSNFFHNICKSSDFVKSLNISWGTSHTLEMLLDHCTYYILQVWVPVLECFNPLHLKRLYFNLSTDGASVDVWCKENILLHQRPLIYHKLL